jgi:hypothetical protein
MGHPELALCFAQYHSVALGRQVLKWTLRFLKGDLTLINEINDRHDKQNGTKHVGVSARVSKDASGAEHLIELSVQARAKMTQLRQGLLQHEAIRQDKSLQKTATGSELTALKNKLVAMNAAKESELAALNATKESELAALKNDHSVELKTEQDKLKKDLDTLKNGMQTALNTLNTKIVKLKTGQDTLKTVHSIEQDKLKKDLDALKKAHSIELTTLKTGHCIEQDKLKKAHSIELTMLKTGHSDELTRLKAGHSDELTTLKVDNQELSNKRKSIKQLHRNENRKRRRLRKDHANHINAMREENNEQKQCYDELRKENDEHKQCYGELREYYNDLQNDHDDYKEKCNKLQDSLTQKDGTMPTRIQALSTNITRLHAGEDSEEVHCLNRLSGSQIGICIKHYLKSTFSIVKSQYVSTVEEILGYVFSPVDSGSLGKLNNNVSYTNAFYKCLKKECGIGKKNTAPLHVSLDIMCYYVSRYNDWMTNHTPNMLCQLPIVHDFVERYGSDPKLPPSNGDLHDYF